MKTQTQKLLSLAILSAGLIIGMAPVTSDAGQQRVLKVQTNPKANTTIGPRQILYYEIKLNRPQPEGTRVVIKQEFFCNGILARGSGLVELDAQGKYKEHTLPISRMSPACRRDGAIFKARFRGYKGPVKPRVVELTWKVTNKRAASQ